MEDLVDHAFGVSFQLGVHRKHSLIVVACYLRAGIPFAKTVDRKANRLESLYTIRAELAIPGQSN